MIHIRYVVYKIKIILLDKIPDIEQTLINRWPEVRKHIEQTAQSNHPYDIQEACKMEVAVHPLIFIESHVYEKLKLMSYKTNIPLLAILQPIAVIVCNKIICNH